MSGVSGGHPPSVCLDGGRDPGGRVDGENTPLQYIPPGRGWGRRVGGVAVGSTHPVLVVQVNGSVYVGSGDEKRVGGVHGLDGILDTSFEVPGIFNESRNLGCVL